jgi:hypothetical protein
MLVLFSVTEAILLAVPCPGSQHACTIIAAGKNRASASFASPTARQVH